MKRREIFIELTSLLDVILIMIFVLLTQARAQTAKALENQAAEEKTSARLQEEVEDLSASLDHAWAELGIVQEENDQLKRQLMTQDLVLDESLVITIRAEDETIIREIRDGVSDTIAYTWGNETYVSNKLKSLLLQDLSETEKHAVFIVFQYDRSGIYQNEYQMIESLIQEIKTTAKDMDLPLSLMELDLGTDQ
ncbi:MAG: hypothetical protein IIY45_14945 [Firmicutes bacterium]|nr:hypothetical protein [Bacillota bacterium]